MKKPGTCTLGALDRYPHPLTYARAVSTVESMLADGDIDSADEVICYLVEIGAGRRGCREDFFIALGIRQAIWGIRLHRDGERRRRANARAKARFDAHARRLGLLPKRAKTRPANLPVDRRSA